ncbi:MAG: hypothetical protein ACFUZC_22840 [Chthoniobacteraceae bacterium]
MFRKYVALVLSMLLLTPLGVVAEEGAQPWIESVKADQHSSTSRFLVEEYMYRLPQNEGYKHEVWLVSTADASKRMLLYTHQRNVRVVLSPDDRWLIINNEFASNESNLLLFRQKKGIKFEEVKDDIANGAWNFLAKKEKKAPCLDHNYAEVLRWTDDHTVLICLSGHLDSKNHVQDWLCLYDVTTKTFSTDFDANNKRHVVVEPGKTSL